MVLTTFKFFQVSGFPAPTNLTKVFRFYPSSSLIQDQLNSTKANEIRHLTCFGSKYTQYFTATSKISGDTP